MNEILQRLKGVKQLPRDRWVACCPAHPDKHPSLYLAQGKDGRVLIDCKAGCDPHDVVRAIGLSWKSFFAEGSTPPPKQKNDFDDFYVAIFEAELNKGKSMTRKEIDQYKQSKANGLSVAR